MDTQMKVLIDKILQYKIQLVDASKDSRQINLQRSFFLIFLQLFIVALMLFMVFLLGVITDSPVSLFTRDISAIAKTKSYYGFLSRIGFLLWMSTSAVCLFGATLLKSFATNQTSSRKTFLYFLTAGGFTLVLLLDDLFTLHEVIDSKAPILTERMVYIFYACCMSAFVIYFADHILASAYPVLILALIFFALSIALDHNVLSSNWREFTEDSFKFAGIVLWSTYFIYTTYTAVQVSLRNTKRDI
jgi:hypothetical protein